MLLDRFADWLERRGSHYLINRDGKPYMSRYYLIKTRWFGLFINRFYDHDIWLHCHPWHWFTIILRGGYVEEEADGTTHYRTAGNFKYRRSQEFHCISRIIDPGNTWTLFWHGKHHRTWGFMKEGKWIPVHTKCSKDMKGWFLPRRME